MTTSVECVPPRLPSSRDERPDGRRSIASPISSEVWSVRGTKAGPRAELREELRVCAATLGELGRVSGLSSLGSGVRSGDESSGSRCENGRIGDCRCCSCLSPSAVAAVAPPPPPKSPSLVVEIRFDVEILLLDLLLRVEMLLALRCNFRFGRLTGIGGGPMSPTRPNTVPLSISEKSVATLELPGSSSPLNELSISNKCFR